MFNQVFHCVSSWCLSDHDYPFYVNESYIYIYISIYWYVCFDLKFVLCFSFSCCLKMFQVHCVLLGYTTVIRSLFPVFAVNKPDSKQHQFGRVSRQNAGRPPRSSQFPGCCRAYYIYSTSLGSFCHIYIYIFYLFVGCCRCFARWDVTCLRSNASLRIRDPQLNFQFVSNDSHWSPRQQKRKKMREHVLHWAGGRVRSGLFF